MENSILITGCAGFIGSNLTDFLLEKGFKVIGIDNFDPFYPKETKNKNLSEALRHQNFSFFDFDFTDNTALKKLPQSIDFVIHLGGKAGVRPSIEAPSAYIQANIIGTQNILDFMVERNIKKYIFASSSSVYGNNEKIPFSEADFIDKPISPYAFTKKSCELLNHTYHHLYGINTINLRFFTVFGERQRPDLAIHKFVKRALNNESITLYGDGSTSRDYTYIQDIVDGIWRSYQYLQSNENIFQVINLGNNSPIKLSELVEMIYSILEKEPIIEYLPMQAGDVERTYADISSANKILGYKPQTSMQKGLENFIAWYQLQVIS